MIKFTKEDESAIDQLAMRFFTSSHATMTASGQIKQLLNRVRATEERFEERLRLNDKREA